MFSSLVTPVPENPEGYLTLRAGSANRSCAGLVRQLSEQMSHTIYTPRLSGTESDTSRPEVYKDSRCRLMHSSRKSKTWNGHQTEVGVRKGQQQGPSTRKVTLNPRRMSQPQVIRTFYQGPKSKLFIETR